MRERNKIRSCDNCQFYGECDHQGPYQKNNKWCYEVRNDGE